MVITALMPVSGIVASWPETKPVILHFGIPHESNKALQEHTSGEDLAQLISELNEVIGSSNITCVNGG
ncbi:hypothetical protein Bsel_3008 [[Bacillus] selenitireducens MLS10]|uniref:Uncharacterized protein n=1 Tax=Bacillus selenitireducens (strain ATCC 700615 / DSM 15326 / MLS10) TaxID=439292 RepID=D6XZE4_BACIE|nr:hypothetical protein Bsel_0789 [[Bacillus] selenitireducens MLS10]ADI00490.1 hypothetical protein Bsel_3008 [[Bacillus] selenitireducens MLS10]